MPDIKFCGLTRPEDAEAAVALGAAYAGFVFAESRRRLSIKSAVAVGAGLGGAPIRRVGVFAGAGPDEIERTVDEAGLDVVQLHGAEDAELLATVRERVPAIIWIVVHVGKDSILPAVLDGASAADGLLLDARVQGELGGTGQTFEWAQVVEPLASLRGRTRIIVAGGLHPGNVARAIETLAPDVVDVSSGVEDSPGIKNHARMRAFSDAVKRAGKT